MLKYMWTENGTRVIAGLWIQERIWRLEQGWWGWPRSVWQAPLCYRGLQHWNKVVNWYRFPMRNVTTIAFSEINERKTAGGYREITSVS